MQYAPTALSEQARAQIERDALCATAHIVGGGAVKGLFSVATKLRDERGNIVVGAEEPQLTVHIDEVAGLEVRSTELEIDGRRYRLNRILRHPQTYLADLVLGGAGGGIRGGNP